MYQMMMLKLVVPRYIEIQSKAAVNFILSF